MHRQKNKKYDHLLKLVSSSVSIAACVTLFVLLSCSTQKHYKTLSFFFDGVPDPTKKDTVKSPDSIAGRGKRLAINLQQIAKKPSQASIHPPYQEKKCELCHQQGSVGKALVHQQTLCFKCHEDFGKKFAVLHGPVASGYCTACHNAHSAENPRLLKRSGQNLCYYCHSKQELVRVPIHKEIKDAACTECHDPHGGAGPFLK